MPLIYHLTSRAAWEQAQQAGEYRADSLETQGFIHFSGRDQVVRVANAVYGGTADLVLLVVDVEALHGELRHEPPDPTIPAHHYDGELFPHLYGVLNTDAVISVYDFPAREDGTFEMPENVM